VEVSSFPPTTRSQRSCRVHITVSYSSAVLGVSEESEHVHPAAVVMNGGDEAKVIPADIEDGDGSSASDLDLVSVRAGHSSPGNGESPRYAILVSGANSLSTGCTPHRGNQPP
jgi:hypothetical protein